MVDVAVQNGWNLAGLPPGGVSAAEVARLAVAAIEDVVPGAYAEVIFSGAPLAAVDGGGGQPSDGARPEDRGPPGRSQSFPLVEGAGRTASPA